MAAPSVASQVAVLDASPDTSSGTVRRFARFTYARAPSTGAPGATVSLVVYPVQVVAFPAASLTVTVTVSAPSASADTSTAPAALPAASPSNTVRTPSVTAT